MATSLVIHGLVKRRAVIAGDIEAAQKLLAQLVLDLEAIDASILQFDPSYRLLDIQPKAFRPPSDWAHRGQMGRMVLQVLRKATEPLTTRDIALRIMASRALDLNNQDTILMMTKRVRMALYGKRRRGVVENCQGPGQYMLWRLV